MDGHLLIGEVAERIGCQSWHIRRLFELGLLPDVPRAGRWRMVPVDMVPEIRRLVRERYKKGSS